VKFISVYEKMQNYSHFGAELSPEIKDVLNKGNLINHFFNQSDKLLIDVVAQKIIFGLIWTGAANEMAIVEKLKDKFGELLKDAELLKEIEGTETVELFAELINKNKEKLLTYVN
jgi:F0F1-type ATP synthase alpha subunit